MLIFLFFGLGLEAMVMFQPYGFYCTGCFSMLKPCQRARGTLDAGIPVFSVRTGVGPVT